MKLLPALLLIFFLPLAACTSLRSSIDSAVCSSLRTSLPLTKAQVPTPLSSLVSVGHATASYFAKGSWVPAPAFDYEFMVLERRYADRWEAVKEIHYRDPRYDGRAGPRDQTLFFEVLTVPAADGGLYLTVVSTLGKGRGHSDVGSGKVSLELISAEKGWFVRYDRIRISQTRAIKEGRLEEVVELFSKPEGRELPFMRMEEKGTIYLPATRSVP